MPTATFSTLLITDGVTTIDLLGSPANYELNDNGWSPQVTTRRTDDMGGSGAYEDVDEQLSVNVLGSTGTVALSNLAALSQLLDQAEAWSNGAQVDPVFIRTQPKGSTQSAALQALILGRSRDALFTLPATWNDHIVGNSIEESHLHFARRGLWLAQAATTIGQSSAAAVGALMTCPAAGAQSILAPLSIQLTLPQAVIPPGVLIVAPANRIAILEAETLVTTKWASVTDAGNNPRGSNVLRYTPTDALPSTSNYITFSSGTDFKRVVVYAMVRNNSATTTFQLHANLSSSSMWDAGASIATRDQFIDTSAVNANPQVICLGEISHPDYARRVSLTAQASAASGSLDIDYLVFVATTDESTNILAHGAIDTTGLATPILQIDPITPALTPAVTMIGGGILPVDYEGDSFFQSAGTSIAGIWLATGGSTAGSWRFCTGSGVWSGRLSAFRRAAFLVPQ